VPDSGTTHCNICQACIKDHLFHCSVIANCISLKNFRNYLVMSATVFVVCWSVLAINGWVMLDNLGWYIKDPSIELSRNDMILVVSSFIVFMWGTCMSKRLRLLKFLMKIPAVASLVHVKLSYNIELQLANHAAS